MQKVESADTSALVEQTILDTDASKTIPWRVACHGFFLLLHSQDRCKHDFMCVASHQ